MDIKFDEYKIGLENLIQEMDIIYSGDIIKSETSTISMDLLHRSISSKMIRQVIIDIYNWSFNEMIKRSKEIIINNSDFLKIEPIIKENNASFLFYSSNYPLEKKNYTLKNKTDNSFLPEKFYKKSNQSNLSNISTYFSDNIIDDVDDYHIYITNKPIQSMVWVIQNMDYKIENGRHTLKYQQFHCDYKSYKIRVISKEKLRDDKIKYLLDE